MSENIINLINVSSIGKSFIDTSQTKTIMAKLNKCLVSKGIKGIADSMLIYGNQRSGKTRLITEFIDRSEANILYFEMPTQPTIKSMIFRMRKEIGDPMYEKSRNTITDTVKIQKQLEVNDCDMVIIDECHHLIDSNRNKLILDTADWIKQLINELNIPVVLVGLHHLNRIVLKNKQLSDRILYEHTLDYLKLNSTDFALIIRSYVSMLSVQRSKYSQTMDFASRIHAATKGKIGFISQFFMECELKCRYDHRTSITKEFFAELYDDIFTRWADENPFSESFNIDHYIETALDENKDSITER